MTNQVTSQDHVTTDLTEDEALFQEEEDISFRDPDLVYTIVNTELFEIDDEDYIAVVDSSTFADYDNVEFYVSNRFVICKVRGSFGDYAIVTSLICLRICTV